MDINLQRRQELFLDGIETSLDMANICYVRLRQSLFEYCEIDDSGRTLELHEKILLDAWSIVDIINRLRLFISQVPGLKQNEQVKLFQSGTKEVESLRDFVQHLDHELISMEKSGNPLWGTLSWIYQTPDMEVNKEVKVLLLIPGRIAVSKGHPIDHISLTAMNITINLSQLISTTDRFKKKYNQAVEMSKGQINSKGILEITLE
jgi:hypothetical protein